MRDVMIFVAAVAVWFVLMRWVLPLLGLPTCCCGGSCPVETQTAPVRQVEPVPGDEPEQIQGKESLR